VVDTGYCITIRIRYARIFHQRCAASVVAHNRVFCTLSRMVGTSLVPGLAADAHGPAGLDRPDSGPRQLPVQSFRIELPLAPLSRHQHGLYLSRVLRQALASDFRLEAGRP
jgi:hypothetical protein